MPVHTSAHTVCAHVCTRVRTHVGMCAHTHLRQLRAPPPRHSSRATARPRCGHTGPGRDVAAQDPAAMWPHRTRPRCGHTGPGRDVAAQDPAAMWPHRTRPRCGHTGPGRDVAAQDLAAMWPHRTRPRCGRTGPGRDVAAQDSGGSETSGHGAHIGTHVPDEHRRMPSAMADRRNARPAAAPRGATRRSSRGGGTSGRGRGRRAAAGLSRLYLGVADGMSTARVWTCRYSK